MFYILKYLLSIIDIISKRLKFILKNLTKYSIKLNFVVQKIE